MRLSATFFLSIFLICIYSTAVQAADEERWFQIELLVFENIETGDESEDDASEIWPDNPGSPNYDDTIELQDQPPSVAPATNDPATGTGLADTITTIDLLPTTDISDNGSNPDSGANIDASTDTGQPPLSEIIPFQELPASELQLLEIKNKLIDSKAYRPLLLIGWRQPVLSRKQAKAIVINKKILGPQDILDQSIADLNLDTLLQPPSLITPAPSPLVKIEQEKSEDLEAHTEKLEGTVKVILERYLHLRLDLIYHEAAQEQTVFSFFNFNKKTSPSLFRMTQKRRLRSKELHYFDHPRFGVLALITPYEKPDPDHNTANNNPN